MSKQASMISFKSTYKQITIIILLGLSFSQSSFAFPRKNVLDTCVELSFYLCLLGLADHILDGICQSTPTLYEQKNSDERSLQCIEERTYELKYIIENCTEDALIPFRATLIQQYEKVLKNRNGFSLFFERDVPHQPWALLNLELQQYLDCINSCKSKLFQRTFSRIEGQPLTHEESLAFFDRIQKVEDLLISIKNALQSLPSFQSECSQARQEKTISAITHQIGIFICLYLIHQQGKYLDRYC